MATFGDLLTEHPLLLEKKWTRPVIPFRERGQVAFTIFTIKRLSRCIPIIWGRHYCSNNNNNDTKSFESFSWHTLLEMSGKHTSQFAQVCKQGALPCKTCTLQQNSASELERKNAGVRACHSRKREGIGRFC